MNLELLQQRIAVTENPGLDTLDPRWSELSGLVQDGRFSEAAEKSEELLREGVYDVRIVGYLCFGHFLDGGLTSLGPICSALSLLVNDNWEAFGPAAARAKLTQQSLGWLFKQLLKQLQHCENVHDEAWEAWQATPPAELDEVLTQTFELRQALGARLDKGAAVVLEPLGKVDAWLRAFQAAMQQAAAPAADERALAPPAAPALPGAAVATTTTTTTTTAAPANGGGSYHLTQLMRKIEAFATLLERGKLTPALIVAEDINATLAQFDPLLYFPQLFSRFIRLAAVHAGDLAKAAGDREAPPWKALRSLYQVDLEQFLALD
jgi:hypothetical protein